MKPIRVEPLNSGSFADFGTVLETEGRDYTGEAGVYKWFEKQAQVDGAGTVSINLLEVIERPRQCRKFEAHARTTETILPLTGDIVVAGMPPGDASAGKLRAFRVPVGKGICWKPGAWHYAPYPVSGDTVCAVIFRHQTGADDVIFAELDAEAVIQR